MRLRATVRVSECASVRVCVCVCARAGVQAWEIWDQRAKECDAERVVGAWVGVGEEMRVKGCLRGCV